MIIKNDIENWKFVLMIITFPLFVMTVGIMLICDKERAKGVF